MFLRFRAAGSLLLVCLPLFRTIAKFFAGFLVPQADLAHAKSFTEASGLIAGKLITPMFFLALVGIMLSTGLAEELLFRGIFQNLIEHKMRNTVFALAVVSIIFGAAHLEDPMANGVLYVAPKLLDPFTWNWPYMGMATIAGVGYGFVFIATRSILFSALLHALVDTIWGTLFVT